MAIRVTTGQPDALLAAIKKAIDERRVETWEYDNGYFTHTPTQWHKKAWFLPKVEYGALVFNIIKPKNAAITWEFYGVYHGRFIEMLIVHFHDRFTSAEASATPVAGDLVS